MKTTTPTLLTASELAERHHLSYQTLNYYTNLGLLRVAKRDGHQRLYDGQDVRRSLDTISRLKDEGYPLRLICRMLVHGVPSLSFGLAGGHGRAAKK